MRLIKRHTLVKPATDYVIDAPTPSNISYWWNVGSLLGLSLGIQIITGVTLAMHYNANVLEAFNSVEHIMRDVNNGWLIRYLHSNTASAFFFLVYLHIGRGLYYGSYKAPRTLTWTLGTIILILMMATAFLGYVLPYGQMSLWGATVITNLLSAIPWVGQDIVEFVWGGFSVNNATLNRFFSLHFVLPFILAALVLMHLIALHDSAGSNNPLGISGNYDRIPFAPYFIFKDIITVFIFMWVLSVFVFFIPNALGDSENYVMANPMQTPPAIVPEWYLLPFYAILRSIPNKLIGVISMFSAILIILAMTFGDIAKIRGNQFKPFNKGIFFLFIGNLLLLLVLGAKHVESPFIEAGQLATLIYFVYFGFVVPMNTTFENSINELYIFVKKIIHSLKTRLDAPAPFTSVGSPSFSTLPGWDWTATHFQRGMRQCAGCLTNDVWKWGTPKGNHFRKPGVFCHRCGAKVPTCGCESLCPLYPNCPTRKKFIEQAVKNGTMTKASTTPEAATEAATQPSTGSKRPGANDSPDPRPTQVPRPNPEGESPLGEIGERAPEAVTGEDYNPEIPVESTENIPVEYDNTEEGGSEETNNDNEDDESYKEGPSDEEPAEEWTPAPGRQQTPAPGRAPSTDREYRFPEEFVGSQTPEEIPASQSPEGYLENLHSEEILSGRGAQTPEDTARSSSPSPSSSAEDISRTSSPENIPKPSSSEDVSGTSSPQDVIMEEKSQSAEEISSGGESQSSDSTDNDEYVRDDGTVVNKSELPSRSFNYIEDWSSTSPTPPRGLPSCKEPLSGESTPTGEPLPEAPTPTGEYLPQGEEEINPDETTATIDDDLNDPQGGNVFYETGDSSSDKDDNRDSSMEHEDTPENNPGENELPGDAMEPGYLPEVGFERANSNEDHTKQEDSGENQTEQGDSYPDNYEQNNQQEGYPTHNNNPEIPSGYYDEQGNYYPPQTPSGYYDNQGNYYPTQTPSGYYDNQGNYYPTQTPSGYYDEQGNYYPPQTPSGYYDEQGNYFGPENNYGNDPQYYNGIPSAYSENQRNPELDPNASDPEDTNVGSSDGGTRDSDPYRQYDNFDESSLGPVESWYRDPNGSDHNKPVDRDTSQSPANTESGYPTPDTNSPKHEGLNPESSSNSESSVKPEAGNSPESSTDHGKSEAQQSLPKESIFFGGVWDPNIIYRNTKPIDRYGNIINPAEYPYVSPHVPIKDTAPSPEPAPSKETTSVEEATHPEETTSVKEATHSEETTAVKEATDAKETTLDAKGSPASENSDVADAEGSPDPENSHATGNSPRVIHRPTVPNCVNIPVVHNPNLDPLAIGVTAVGAMGVIALGYVAIHNWGLLDWVRPCFDIITGGFKNWTLPCFDADLEEFKKWVIPCFDADFEGIKNLALSNLEMGFAAFKKAIIASININPVEIFTGIYKNTVNLITIKCDAPTPWGLYFQDSASPQMEALGEFHDGIMYFLTAILFSVGWIMLACRKFFKSPISRKYTNHGSLVEIIWTISPGIILVLIAFTSFKLLYLMDEVSDVNMTLYIEGHQWYWSYQYPDFLDNDGEFIEYDSYLTPDSDLETGALRMLDVDERVIIPEITHVRFIVTSGDVIHCYACPSLGIKADAYPGRLNQASALINRLGTFYGQCSEICGILHSSMPISIESVSLEKFLLFLWDK